MLAIHRTHHRYTSISRHYHQYFITHLTSHEDVHRPRSSNISHQGLIRAESIACQAALRGIQSIFGVFCRDGFQMRKTGRSSEWHSEKDIWVEIAQMFSDDCFFRRDYRGRGVCIEQACCQYSRLAYLA